MIKNEVMVEKKKMWKMWTNGKEEHFLKLHFEFVEYESV